MQRLKVRDVMTPKVIGVRPDDSFKEIVETLMVYDISGVPVVDDDGSLLGIVTEADLLPKEARTSKRHSRLVGLVADILRRGGRSDLSKATARTVRDMMTTRVVTVGPETSVREAARRMVRAGVKRAPVVEGGSLVGMISRHDVLDVFDRPDEELRAWAEALLRRSLFVPPDADVTVSVVDGVASLQGRVHFDADRSVVEHIVAGMDGIVAVENQLVYQELLPRAYV